MAVDTRERVGDRRSSFRGRAVVMALLWLTGMASVQAQQTVVGGSGNDYQATVLIPRELPDVRIAVFERLAAQTSLGDLWLTRSEDGGETWTTPVAIIATAANERHASLVQTSDDGYALFFLRDEGGNSFRIHRASSVDGTVWTDHGRAELGWPSGGEINPEVFRRADGTLIMTYQRLGGAAYLAMSGDEGASWDQLRTQVSAGNAALPRLAVRESDGTHLLVYQTGSSAVSLWLRQSSDPHAWTDTPQLLTPDGNNHDAMPVVLDDGSFAVLWARVIGSAFQIVSAHSRDGSDWLPIRQHSDRPGLHNVQPRVLPGIGYGRMELYWGAGQVPGHGDYDIVRAPHVVIAEMIVFDVDTGIDSIDIDPGDGACADDQGRCSLRAAIMEANALPGRQRIELPAGSYQLTLAGDVDDLGVSGDLDILGDLELVGAGADTTLIDADGIDRVLDIGADQQPVAVSISGIGVTGGVRAFPGLPMQQARGGGIRIGTAASLTLFDSRVVGNEAGLLGAGILNRGRLTVQRSVIEGNHDGASSGGRGGGLATGDNPGASVRITDSLIRDNEAGFRGGGVIVYRDSEDGFGSLVIERSALIGNRAGSGAGFYADAAGSFVLENSTVSGNRGDGLFIDNFCETRIRFSTIAGNGTPSSPLPTGIIDVHGPTNPLLRLEGTVVADNHGGDCHGIFGSDGYNLLQSSGCALVDPRDSDRIGVAALITSLQDADGVSPFHALLGGSPAIDSGGEGCAKTDQLGTARPLDGNGDGVALCDVGAVEQPYVDAIFVNGFEAGD